MFKPVNLSPVNHRRSLDRLRTPVVAMLLGAALAACASNPPPDQQMAVSRAAVVHATTADTTTYAPLELQAAKDKLAAAETAMQAKNYSLASDLAAEAEVNAHLAESKSDSAKATKAAQDAQDSVRVLRDELNRKQQQPN